MQEVMRVVSTAVTRGTSSVGTVSAMQGSGVTSASARDNRVNIVAGTGGTGCPKNYLTLVRVFQTSLLQSFLTGVFRSW